MELSKFIVKTIEWKIRDIKNEYKNIMTYIYNKPRMKNKHSRKVLKKILL